MKPEDFRNLTESARQILSGEPSSLVEFNNMLQPNYLEREYDLDDLPDDLFPEKEEEPEEITPNPYGLTLLGILGLLSRGLTFAQIAGMYGVPIWFVLLFLRANPDLSPDNPITDPYKPGGKEEGNPEHPGWGGGSRWRVGAPSDNQPHQA